MYEDSFTTLLLLTWYLSLIAQGSREGSFSRAVQGSKRARVGTARIGRTGERIESIG